MATDHELLKNGLAGTCNALYDTKLSDRQARYVESIMRMSYEIGKLEHRVEGYRLMEPVNLSDYDGFIEYNGNQESIVKLVNYINQYQIKKTAIVKEIGISYNTFKRAINGTASKESMTVINAWVIRNLDN